MTAIVMNGAWAREHPASNIQAYLKTISQGRYAQPAEIADTIAFLSSDKAGHITGQCICVDGRWVHAGVGVASLN